MNWQGKPCFFFWKKKIPLDIFMKTKYTNSILKRTGVQIWIEAIKKNLLRRFTGNGF